jgi:hypothetical protein
VYERWEILCRNGKMGGRLRHVTLDPPFADVSGEILVTEALKMMEGPILGRGNTQREEDVPWTFITRDVNQNRG